MTSCLPATENLVQKAKNIKLHLDSLNIGYNGSQHCNCIVGPNPFFLSESEHRHLIKQGLLFKEWLKTTIELCNEAYRNPKLQWLARIIEGNVSREAIDLHRRLHLEHAVKLPLLIRPDMSDIGKSVEVQIPGSGWGFMTSIYSIVAENSSFIGPNNAFGMAINLSTNNPRATAAYILYNDPFFKEVEYFCRNCQEKGISVRLFFKNVPAPDEVSFVRRPPLEDLVSYVGADKLIEAHLDGNLVIDPDLSLLFDQKIAIAFPFDPRLADYYSDEIRDLFPKTYLVQEEIIPHVNNKKMKWNEISSLSRKQRQVIIKYGGAKKGMRAGGKAVYNLADCNKEETEQLIANALKLWKNDRSPWIIQERIQKKFNVIFFDPTNEQIAEGQFYAMFRPMYVMPLNGADPFIANNCALFRKEWKVHGSSDAVVLPVEIQQQHGNFI